MPESPRPVAERPEPAEVSKREKSARFWASGLLVLSAETKSLAGKVNASTAAVLLGLCVIVTFALLADMVMRVSVDLSWLKVTAGGGSWSFIFVWAFLLVVFALVTYVCVGVFKEIERGNTNTEAL